MNSNEYAQIVADQREELKLINPKDLCSRKEESLFDIGSPFSTNRHRSTSKWKINHLP